MLVRFGMPEVLTEDWTEENGAANSSEIFKFLGAEIGRMIRNSAFDLISGGSDDVGHLIIARLAHLYKLKPTISLAQMKESEL